MQHKVNFKADLCRHELEIFLLAGVAEYTDCISAEGKNSPDKCPGYDMKQSECEASVMLEL